MVVKCDKTILDDLCDWNRKNFLHNNGYEITNDDERSIAFSVKLLLKHRNILQPSLVKLPSHLVTSPNCQCHRSFHLFCTDLFDENIEDLSMINVHPTTATVRQRDKETSRRTLTANRKIRDRKQNESDQDAMVTSRSEPSHVNTQENQVLEKKIRVPPKLPPRTTSLNVPAPISYQRPIPFPSKYSPSFRAVKQPTTAAHLHIRAISVFEQSPSTSQVFFPRGPPPSPKTPTQESSMILLNSITASPLRAISILPRTKNPNDIEKKSVSVSPSKVSNYEDHVRAYLSASDCSDDEKNSDKDDHNNHKNNNDDDTEHDEKDNDEYNNDKDSRTFDKLLKAKINQPVLRSHSLSRPGTGLRERLLLNKKSRLLSFAEVYYSPTDSYKTQSNKVQNNIKPRSRLANTTSDDDERLTTITKTTIKTIPVPESKSVFGFSKTASSMHFGHAASRLALQASFERWPRPPSRRTPFERKQEVTTLRIATLPLVTS